MSDEKSKSATGPFNAAASPEIEVVFVSDMDNDLEDEDKPLRGNTDPKHDPKYEKNKGYTPMGSGPSLGASSSRSQGQTPVQPENTEAQLSDEEWQYALRNGDHTFESEFNGLRVRVWQTDEPTDRGIHRGRLNEMVVTQGEYGDEVEVAHFKDGDWEKPLEATPERQAVMDAVEEYDGAFLEEQRQKEEQEHAHEQEVEVSKDEGKSR